MQRLFRKLHRTPKAVAQFPRCSKRTSRWTLSWKAEAASDAASAFQLSVHRDVRFEHLGNWATAFGVLCSFLKSRCIGLRHSASHIEMDGRDGPPGIELFQSQVSCRVDALRCEIGGAQLR